MIQENQSQVSIGTENNYLIPTAVCFNSELKEWSAGDEAINKSHSENSRLIRELPLLLMRIQKKM